MTEKVLRGESRSEVVEDQFAAFDRFRDDLLERLDEHCAAYRRERRLLFLFAFAMLALLMALFRFGVI